MEKAIKEFVVKERDKNTIFPQYDIKKEEEQQNFENQG